MGEWLVESSRTWWQRHQRSPGRVARWILLWLPMGLAILLLTPVALVARLGGIRVLGINAGRIGHLAVEPDCFIKERALGSYPDVLPVACAPRGRVANSALLDCWRPHIHWITTPWQCSLLRPLLWHPLLALDVKAYTNSPRDKGGRTYTTIASRWNNRKPVVSIPDAMSRAGAEAARKLGLPGDAWFVCVHNREGGYSPHDEDWHSYRNCRISSYVKAMECIAAAGGWCLRMGDPTMTPLPPMRNTIDYAHHPLRSDLLDLFLMAHCRFFLGNSSGPFLVASIFGRPVALANMAPIERVLPYGSQDIGIPKLLRRRGESAYVPFDEMFGHPSSRYHFAAQFSDDGLELVDNSEEDILALAEEMLARTRGDIPFSDDDEQLQARFKQLMRPQHFSCGSSSHVGRDFLRKHSHLLL